MNNSDTAMKNAQTGRMSARIGHGFRITSEPVLELTDRNGTVINRLPLDGIRYRITPLEGGQIKIEDGPGDDSAMEHHCYVLDLEAQDQGAPIGTPLPSRENNRFYFWYQALPAADGQTAGALSGIGAVDILDISILDRIVPTERKIGRLRGFGTAPSEWPADFPECASPRVTLVYHYHLGIPEGSNSGLPFSLVLGAAVELNAKGEKVARLVISFENDSMGLDAYLET